MTKPNFKEMNRIELKTYLNAHRDDDEAWDVFFGKLEQDRSPDATWYPPPLDESGMRIMEEAFHKRIQEIENR